MLHWDNSNGSFNPTEDMAHGQRRQCGYGKVYDKRVSQRTDRIQVVILKKPTTILSDEHKNILCVINRILKECGKIDSGGNIDEAFFQKAVSFIKNYADKFHHAKEEDILFMELNKDGVLEHCNPIR